MCVCVSHDITLLCITKLCVCVYKCSVHKTIYKLFVMSRIQSYHAKRQNNVAMSIYIHVQQEHTITGTTLMFSRYIP